MWEVSSSSSCPASLPSSLPNVIKYFSAARVSRGHWYCNTPPLLRIHYPTRASSKTAEGVFFSNLTDKKQTLLSTVVTPCFALLTVCHTLFWPSAIRSSERLIYAPMNVCSSLLRSSDIRSYERLLQERGFLGWAANIAFSKWTPCKRNSSNNMSIETKLLDIINLGICCTS